MKCEHLRLWLDFADIADFLAKWSWHWRMYWSSELPWHKISTVSLFLFTSNQRQCLATIAYIVIKFAILYLSIIYQSSYVWQWKISLQFSTKKMKQYREENSMSSRYCMSHYISTTVLLVQWQWNSTEGLCLCWSVLIMHAFSAEFSWQRR